MKDYFGRDLAVGDFVMPLRDSTHYTTSNEPLVVLRLGSETRVQLSGGSYGEAKLLLAVNHETESAKGKAWCDAFREQYKDQFNFEQVQKKSAYQERWILMRIPDGRFIMVPYHGANYPEKNRKFKSAYFELIGTTLPHYMPDFYIFQKEITNRYLETVEPFLRRGSYTTQIDNFELSRLAIKNFNPVLLNYCQDVAVEVGDASVLEALSRLEVQR